MTALEYLKTAAAGLAIWLVVGLVLCLFWS